MATPYPVTNMIASLLTQASKMIGFTPIIPNIYETELFIPPSITPTLAVPTQVFKLITTLRKQSQSFTLAFWPKSITMSLE